MATCSAVTDTVIRVSARPGWYQRTMMQLGDPALEARMHDMAALALRQFQEPSEVIVTAENGSQARVYRLERYRGHWRSE